MDFNASGSRLLSLAALGMAWAGGVPTIAYATDSLDPAVDRPEDDRKLTVGDYFDLERVGDPRISPDGDRIVYVRSWVDITTDRQYSNLWIVDFDGKNHRPLTSGSVRDSSPRWSPDGDRLAFISKGEGPSQIHVRWMDTGQTAKITNLQKGPSNLAWSPDGAKVAFNMLTPGKKPEGVKMPPKPEGAQWAEPPTIINRLVYRSDQSGYLPAGFRQIFVVPAEGGTARQMTHGDYDHGAPEWSTDSESILFSAIRKPEAEWVVSDSEIYEVSLDDRAIRSLSSRKGPDNGPVISPDGKRIAYTGFDERRLSYTVTRLYVMGRDGSEPTLLSGDLDNDTRAPLWSPDGKSVLFSAGWRGSRHLYRATLDGEIDQVTEGEAMLGAYTVGPGGKVAATISTADGPGDIFSFTLRNPKPRRLTNVNEDLLSHRDVGELEEVLYKSSFDGRELQGWLIKPPGFTEDKQYPLVLYIHGGPHGMYGVGFNFEFQTIASEGYLVLYTNPRGSIGYGQEFGNIIQYNYPGDDYFDLMSGVDEVISRGYVDEDHLYVTGGSGGGVLTCWVVGRTGRFRAAVSQYPVINWYSFVGTADFGYSMGWRWFEKWPWEDPEAYDRRSPISLVGSVTTPLKLITGESDWRTPISETEQYYRALKIQKKEAVMVRVPGEAHGVRGRPSHYVAKMLHVREWFDQHKEEAEDDE